MLSSIISDICILYIHFSISLADNEASSSSKEAGNIVLQEVLEEEPKWKVLRVS